MINPSAFLNNWEGGGLEELKRDFEITDSDLTGCEILLASYGTPHYEGYAFVLFRKEEKLYEVTGLHCSCRGLEGQWEPEETSVAALRYRLKNGNLGKDDCDGCLFADELARVLDGLGA